MIVSKPIPMPEPDAPESEFDSSYYKKIQQKVRQLFNELITQFDWLYVPDCAGQISFDNWAEYAFATKELANCIASHNATDWGHRRISGEIVPNNLMDPWGWDNPQPQYCIMSLRKEVNNLT